MTAKMFLVVKKSFFKTEFENQASWGAAAASPR
jgi:hypothetical protein